MRCRSSLVLLAGCNSVFGIGASIEQRDARYFDARTDAAIHCPAPGTPPSFDHGNVVQELVQPCGFYTRSEDGKRALALCDGVISEGPADGTLLQAAPGLAPSSTMTFMSARLGPDGMSASVVKITIDPSGMQPTTTDALLVTRDATAWHETATIATGPGLISSVSQTTRGPNAHVIVDVYLDALHEYVDTGSGWQDHGAFTLADYTRFSRIQLSPDGLRAWWLDGMDVRYADRPTIDAPFADVGLIPGSNGVGPAFIAPDCDAIYFATLGRIWKAPRI